MYFEFGMVPLTYKMNLLPQHGASSLWRDQSVLHGSCETLLSEFVVWDPGGENTNY